MLRSKFAYAFLLVSLLGFLDASYLTIEHYRGVVPPCAIVSGCAAVTTSQYSLIFDIPVALLGTLYYPIILLSLITYLDTKQEIILKWVARCTVLGLLASVYFVYLQTFVIKAWCLYCLGSATTSTILFILGIIVLKTKIPDSKSGTLLVERRGIEPQKAE